MRRRTASALEGDRRSRRESTSSQSLRKQTCRWERSSPSRAWMGEDSGKSISPCSTTRIAPRRSPCRWSRSASSITFWTPGGAPPPSLLDHLLDSRREGGGALLLVDPERLGQMGAGRHPQEEARKDHPDSDAHGGEMLRRAAAASRG